FTSCPWAGRRPGSTPSRTDTVPGGAGGVGVGTSGNPAGTGGAPAGTAGCCLPQFHYDGLLVLAEAALPGQSPTRGVSERGRGLLASEFDEQRSEERRVGKECRSGWRGRIEK